MGKILCATRGGEASYRTQDKAIALAKERGDTLLYVYVVDLHFLDRTSAPVVVDVEQELTKMGEFLLLMAKERAFDKAVQAETICSSGDFGNKLKRIAREEDVALVVLGRPAGEESIFEMGSLETFAQEIETETGVETKIV